MIKEITLIAALVLYSATACKTPGNVDTIKRKSIGFEDTYITKGAYTSSNGNFGVIGLEYESSKSEGGYTGMYRKFDNQEIIVQTVDDNTIFTYSPIQYWNTGQSVDFFAYSPYRDDLTLTVLDDDITINHVVPNTSKVNQVDLLYAVPQKGKNEENSKHNVIRFPFKHALTKVKISARLYAPNPLTVVLHNIDLENIKSKATISLTNGVTPDNNIGNDITYSYESLNCTLPNNDTDVDLDSDPDYVVIGELMMIPQDVSGKVITITYSSGEASEPETKTVTMPVNSWWLSGKVVHYRLIIKLDNDIQFSADVDEWPIEDGSQL